MVTLSARGKESSEAGQQLQAASFYYYIVENQEETPSRQSAGWIPKFRLGEVIKGGYFPLQVLQPMGVVTPAAHQVIRGSIASLHWKAADWRTQGVLKGILEMEGWGLIIIIYCLLFFIYLIKLHFLGKESLLSD